MKTALVMSLVVLALCPALAADQPAAPPAAPSAPAPSADKPAGPPPLPLALRDAVAQALERNLDLAVARINPLSNEQDVVVAESAFDARLDASASHNKSTEEPSSDFSPLGGRTERLSATYTDPLTYGAQWSASLSYNESKNDYSSVAQSRYGLISQSDQASLTLSYSQSLLRNFGLEVNRTGIEEALNSRRISEDQLRTQVFAIVEQVETDYWSLVGANRQLEVTRASRDLAKDFEHQTRVRVEVGVLAPIEITTAEADVAAREETVIIAENAVRNAEDQLRALLRVPEGSADWDRPIQPTDEPAFTPAPVDVERAINDALARRTEVATAQLSIRNAELNEKYRRNQVKPDLSVSASYAMTGNNFDYIPETFTSTQSELVPCTSDPTQYCVVFSPATSTSMVASVQGRGDAFKEIFSRQNNAWSVGFQFSVPIRNRSSKAQLTKAKLALEQAQLQFESLKQQIRVEVRTAARNLDAATQRVATTKKNVELQHKKLEAEQKRYENGLSTAFQVLTYQRDLRDAESSAISALVDFNNALTHLARVRGVLLDERGIKM